MILQVLLVPALYGLAALADGGWGKVTSDNLAYLSCATYLGSVANFCNEPDQEFDCFCNNQPALASIASCYINGFDNSTTKIHYFLTNCYTQSNVNLTLDQFYASYENATVNNLFVNATTATTTDDDDDDDEEEEATTYYYPVKVDPGIMNATMASQAEKGYNFNRSDYYGAALLSYWFLVMFLCGAINWTLYFKPKLGHNSFTNYWKKYISIPATGKYNHDVELSLFKNFIKGIVPTRLETIIVAMWIIVIIGLEASHYHHITNNTIWTSKEGEMGRYVGDRTAITGSFNIPVLILFAGRNNFMQFITRWSYARMLAFHRLTARVIFTIFFVHAVSMTCNGIGQGVYQARNSEPYIRWGFVLFIAFSIMMFQGLLYFRRQNYEVFYIIHLILAIVFIIGGWTHAAGMGYQQLFYSATAVWCFDRAIRISRLIAFGAPIATLELKAEETLKVTVPRPSYWKPQPGQHAFVHFLTPLAFFQSHPFTIVDSVNTNDNKITFYIKIKGGITSSLYNYVAKSEKQIAHIRVSVEGPYGSALPLKRYDNVIFLAGGHGVPGLYYESIELLKQQLPNQKIKFYWMIRHWKSLDWFYSELANFKNTNVNPIIYISKPEQVEGLVMPSLSSSSSSLGIDSEEEKKSTQTTTEITSLDLISQLKASLPYVEFREGRPNVQEIVNEEINSAQGSLAIVACAHVNMVDDARKAVVDQLGAGKKSDVEFFDQLQIW